MSTPHASVRPAGAPMVPMAHPDERDSNGSSTTRDAAVEARKAGQNLAGETRERAVAELDRRSTHAGAMVTEAAGDMRDIARQLREKDRDTPARLADEMADRIERFGAYLKSTDTDHIIADARDFGRRRPLAVAATAAAIGVVAGRMIRAAGDMEVRS
ncbi:MAG: hypothetical protein ACLGG9_02485 [Thermoleophilia bacterium]